MKLTHHPTADSIILEVRRIKDENAAAHGYDLRKIADAARERQRQHPKRMVTRIPPNQEQAYGDESLTRPASEDDL